jgi:hypothetical protein
MLKIVTFYVFVAVLINICIFWDVMLCQWTNSSRIAGGHSYLHVQDQALRCLQCDLFLFFVEKNGVGSLVTG